MVALLANSVIGFTGSPGRSTATNGTCPWRGAARAVAQAVPTGPSRSPSTVLTWAASAPSPMKLSPISIGTPPLRRITLEWSKPETLNAQGTGTRVSGWQEVATVATYILRRLGLALVTLWLL